MAAGLLPEACPAQGHRRSDAAFSAPRRVNSPLSQEAGMKEEEETKTCAAEIQKSEAGDTAGLESCTPEQI